ncbi:mitochondrial nicotinamide adenine dinucleotide transporter SLC25A51-like [Thomomys bottae]
MWQARSDTEHSENVTRGLAACELKIIYSGLCQFVLNTLTSAFCSCCSKIPSLNKIIATPEFATRSVAAMLAGNTEAVFTPLERVQTLLQDHKHHDKFTNTYQAFQTLKCHGIADNYRGLVPIFFRNGCSNVLFFGLRGPIKDYLPTATTRSAHLVNDFICGGLLDAVLGFLFFLVNVAKSRIQSQIGGEFQSFSKVFKTIWLERDRKLANLFRGTHLNYHRSLISWGIINATYEFLLKVI